MISTLYTKSTTVHQRLRTYTANGYSFQMLLIPKGTFLMQGDHEVTFPTDFELGQYPVTQALWEAVMPENPSYFRGAERPVEWVSWDEIMGTKDGKKTNKAKQGFLDRLNALPEIAAQNADDGCRFGLPSEAQWEYAARGGHYGPDHSFEFAGSNYLPEVGWYDDNSQQQTHPVGRKLPNILGLYDMSGNVWEWCRVTWHENHKDLLKDGSARIKSEKQNIRVVRGGSWRYNDSNSRVAFRLRGYAYNRSSNGGFRLSRYHFTL